YGEALAVLSGDGLLNLAFETMLKETLLSSKTLDDYKARVKIMEIISNCAGVNGMIGGQVVDLFGNNNNMDQDKLKFMYNAKTAALFKASVLSGAILGGADKNEIRIMHEFSKNIGLAYQIKDDFLDIEEDINKFTFLNLNNKGKASNKLEELTNNALEELDKIKNKDTSFLRELTILLLNRKK
ncbi:MAG: polyprenyl synthetase family protein, partial [Tissierella sp.]|uniref:polyprenyl synthetase family protein n=1 Tax=Tissierella sp. TaxID=41274 RepID=UPI003F996DC3